MGRDQSADNRIEARPYADVGGAPCVVRIVRTVQTRTLVVTLALVAGGTASVGRADGPISADLEPAAYVVPDTTTPALRAILLAMDNNRRLSAGYCSAIAARSFC